MTVQSVDPIKFSLEENSISVTTSGRNVNFLNAKKAQGGNIMGKFVKMNDYWVIRIIAPDATLMFAYPLLQTCRGFTHIVEVTRAPDSVNYIFSMARNDAFYRDPFTRPGVTKIKSFKGIMTLGAVATWVITIPQGSKEGL